MSIHTHSTELLFEEVLRDKDDGNVQVMTVFCEQIIHGVSFARILHEIINDQPSVFPISRNLFFDIYQSLVEANIGERMK